MNWATIKYNDIEILRNAADHDSNEETNQLSNQEEGDSRTNGHENLAYVADEVAGVASSSLEDKKD